jgi:hypothetical protein
VVGVDAGVHDPNDYAVAGQPRSIDERRELHFARCHVHEKSQIARRNDPFDSHVIRERVKRRDWEECSPNLASPLIDSYSKLAKVV